MKATTNVLLTFSILVLAGCVTKIESMTSNFGTVQNGRKCYTIAEATERFNAPTFQAPPQQCDCRDLVPVKRLVVRAGQSPEVMSCPADAETVAASYAPSLASTYVPAAADLFGKIALGGFIYGGLSNTGRMTQSVTGSPVRTSTLLINAPVPGGVSP